MTSFLLLAPLVIVDSFLPSVTQRCPFSPSRPLFASSVPDSIPYNPFAGGPPPPGDKLPSGLSRFLTQRSVQQQLYYSELNMDETHINWLSEFLRPENVSAVHVDYHGINALPTPDSSSYLCALLNYPEIEVTVKKPMGCAAGRGRGGTGMGDYNRNSNPYLKPKYFEYTELIRPVSIAMSLLAIREQIAEEFAEDLVFLVNEGDTIIRTGVAGSTFENGPNGETVSAGGRSSPFRLANYDLLKQLATKDALLRLASPSSSSSSSSSLSSSPSSLAALRSVASRYMPQIDGHNAWAHGREEPSLADNIIDEIIAEQPKAARRLLEERNRLARKWQEQLVATVQAEQTEWKRWHMSRSFSVSDSDNDDATTLASPSSSSEDGDRAGGISSS